MFIMYVAHFTNLGITWPEISRFENSKVKEFYSRSLVQEAKANYLDNAKKYLSVFTLLN